MLIELNFDSNCVQLEFEELAPSRLVADLSEFKCCGPPPETVLESSLLQLMSVELNFDSNRIRLQFD
jgi:hypothetical protein